MSDRTLPGGGFYRTGWESGGQLDMAGGATLLLGNGEPGTDIDHDMMVDSVSIGDTSVPALVPRCSTGQDGWRASTRRESLLDATRVAATHPGIYAQVDNRSTHVRHEVHHHHPPPTVDRSQVDQVVYQAHLREANIKTEVVAELGKRDVREASMIAEGNILQQRLAVAEAERGERDKREAALRGEGDTLRQRLAATETELAHLRHQSRRVQFLEELVERLMLSTSRNQSEEVKEASPLIDTAGDTGPISHDTPVVNDDPPVQHITRVGEVPPPLIPHLHMVVVVGGPRLLQKGGTIAARGGFPVAVCQGYPWLPPH